MGTWLAVCTAESLHYVLYAAEVPNHDSELVQTLSLTSLAKFDGKHAQPNKRL